VAAVTEVGHAFMWHCVPVQPAIEAGEAAQLPERIALQLLLHARAKGQVL
jgi:hypothetical protein